MTREEALGRIAQFAGLSRMDMLVIGNIVREFERSVLLRAEGAVLSRKKVVPGPLSGPTVIAMAAVETEIREDAADAIRKLAEEF